MADYANWTLARPAPDTWTLTDPANPEAVLYLYRTDRGLRVAASDGVGMPTRTPPRVTGPRTGRAGYPIKLSAERQAQEDDMMARQVEEIIAAFKRRLAK